MKCPVNKSDISIMGNFDSSAASVVMVVLETCNNETSTVTCKSQDEIDEFLKFKYILFAQN